MIRKHFWGLLDAKGKLLSANKSALDFIGKTMDELKAIEFWETPWWNHSDGLKERLKKCIEKAKKGHTDGFEAHHIGKNGEVLYVNFSLRPITDAQGKVYRLLAEGLNINERKRAERSLHASQEKYRNLVENINDVIFSTNLNGVITYISPVMQRTFGYQPDEIMGKHFVEYIHPEDVKSIADRL